MVRDYSEFLPNGAVQNDRQPIQENLRNLGWQPFFSQQIGIDELDRTPPFRVTSVHRSGLHATGENSDVVIPPRSDATVGDWILYDPQSPKDSVLLERKSVVKRRAAGHDRQVQLIAANIDTAFIVTSCNQDFNVARLERYIALSMESDITPVIILTKLDLCDAPEAYIEEAKSISDQVEVVALDARGEQPNLHLNPWCKPGQTVAFLGSSGVGKSTLTNSLSKNTKIETQVIREADGKGRHTTTHRELHFVDGGCAILDTPGMREIQMTDTAGGIETLFSDLYDLSAQCKFNDCAHETEPGCAILGAIASGALDEARMKRWKKLAAEDQFNSESLAERRSKDKAFHKRIKSIKKSMRK